LSRLVGLGVSTGTEYRETDASLHSSDNGRDIKCDDFNLGFESIKMLSATSRFLSSPLYFSSALRDAAIITYGFQIRTEFTSPSHAKIGHEAVFA
jgi:hypothetical protein